jgi:hypothetical protein
MLADRASPTLPALLPLAVVVAEDVPMAVPALCTAAVGVTAPAAIGIAADTRASAAPAAGAAAEMPRQTVDQILFLPGLRQLIAGAQLLQLGDGLRARTNKADVAHRFDISARPVGGDHEWATRTSTRVW